MLHAKHHWRMFSTYTPQFGSRSNSGFGMNSSVWAGTRMAVSP